MTLSNYPTSIDTNENLYQVHDALRVVLAEDYNPGDTSIDIIGEESMMRMFNSTGIITLTDQCNDPNLRGLSFYYGSRTLTTFDQLVVLDGFTDVSKPKLLTSVTQNVMAVHHNSLKDAVIAIETFAGVKGTTAIRPLEGSMEERINYLRKIDLLPKAWFKSDKNIGLYPVTINFTDQSFRTGSDGTSYPVTYLWDFGDNTTSTLQNPTHIYEEPGAYDVSLTVTNYFGQDTVKFPSMIIARGQAPDYAVIDIVEGTGQKLIESPSPLNGPYITTPALRSPINSIINIGIRTLPTTNINPNTNKTFSGEPVDINDIPIDPVSSYTWSISDDVNHSNSLNTRSVFSIGGIYDLTLRVDTTLGAYRITNYSNALDIVENFNLWLWTDSSSTSYPQSVTASEFGLISETFKIQSTALNLEIKDSFLTSNNVVVPNKAQQLREFYRNNGFSQQAGGSPSGNGGQGFLYWSSGREYYDPITNENINGVLFNGFQNTYNLSAIPFPISRPWNWISFPSPENLYFFLGQSTIGPVLNSSPTNQNLTEISLTTSTETSTPFAITNYTNGANELVQNIVSFDNNGSSNQGDMSVYRTAWHSNSGYILRNNAGYVENPTQINPNFFRIKSFYKTSGNTIEPFVQITKLLDMVGGSKTEGQLVPLSGGVYFFTNSGSVTAYNTLSGTWSIGGPGTNSATFRSLQDTSIQNFDSGDQTFLATSDNNTLAYLSFDYSRNTFIKFNEVDTTFSSITSRSPGKQWQMCIF